MKNSITSFIRETLRSQAEPPRRVNYTGVLRAVLREKSMIFLFVLGLAMALLFFLLSSGANPSDRIFIALLGFFPLFIAAVPFYYARRIFDAIKIGKVLFAEVESVEFSPNSRNTIDAVENGFAQGTWRLPDGQLIDFQIDRPWAKDIKIGSSVELLVASAKFNGIFPLGLRE